VVFIDSDDLYHPLALQRLHYARQPRGRPILLRSRVGRASQCRPERAGHGVIGPARTELDDFLGSVRAQHDPLWRSNGTPRCGLGPGSLRSTIGVRPLARLKLARHGTPVRTGYRLHPSSGAQGNRMSVTVTANYYQLITDVAKREHRLAHCVPKRLGVQMCEIAIDAVHQRRLRSLWPAAEQLVHGPAACRNATLWWSSPSCTPEARTRRRLVARCRRRVA
jgi:hypothetical protein